MIALIQRVTQASVSVDGVEHGRIGPGLLALVCAEPGDTDPLVDRLVTKTLKLRIFADETGRMNRSLLDTGGSLLVVSQFTLAADTRSGHRPSFSKAADPVLGRRMYERFVTSARAAGVPVQTGEFGAHMQVALVNDGPATFRLQLGAAA